VGTRLQLTRSGGMAGLSLVASVDLDQLPKATAKEVRAALAQVDFDRPAASTPGRRRMPGAADTFQYDLVVTGTELRSLTAHEPVSDPGLRTLFEVLLPLAEPE